MKKRIAFIATLVGVASIAATASAGFQWPLEVGVYHDSNGGGNGYGTVTGARISPDNVQYIGCETTRYPSGGGHGICFAKDASEEYISCSTTDEPLLETMEDIGVQSYVQFRVNKDSSCAWLIVGQSSRNMD